MLVRSFIGCIFHVIIITMITLFDTSLVYFSVSWFALYILIESATDLLFVYFIGASSNDDVFDCLLTISTVPQSTLSSSNPESCHS